MVNVILHLRHMIAISKVIGKSVDELLKEEIQKFDYTITDNLSNINSVALKTAILDDESKEILYKLCEKFLSQKEIEVFDTKSKDNSQYIVESYHQIMAHKNNYFILDKVMTPFEVRNTYIKNKSKEVSKDRKFEFFANLLKNKNGILNKN